MEDARMNYAKSIESIRIRAAMSQAEVAERMTERGFSFHSTTVSKVERGERRLALDEAAALAAVLHVSIDSLTGARPDTWRDAYKTGYEQALRDFRAVTDQLRP
jgi:transcriptional regulator with XRE-family HTH domain